jgi:isochorismate pyruvate lyase
MTREPAACGSMAELRAEIDRLDRELVALLARRAGYIDRAAAVRRAWTR